MAQVVDSWRGGGFGKGAYTLEAGSAAQVAATIQGVAGQTANVFNVKNSSGTILFGVDASGNVTVNGTVTELAQESGTSLVLSASLQVGTTSLLSGDVTMSSGLSVAGATTFVGDVVANHNLTVNNSLVFNGFAYGNVLFLNEQVNAPTHTAEKGVLYVKDVAGVSELHYKDSAGSATQVTSAGAAFVTLTGTQTLSNKTLTAPKIVSGGFIADANGNELIIFTTTADAVNEITFANGGTGVNPKFTASGETNVGIDFQAKGTGVYRLLGTVEQAAELRLYEDTTDGTNYTAFKVGTQAGDITYTLPVNDGDSGQFLTSDGSGVLSWTTASGFAWGASITDTTGDGVTVAYTGTSSGSNHCIVVTSPSAVSIDAVKITCAGGSSFGSLAVLTPDVPNGNSNQIFVGKTDASTYFVVKDNGIVVLTPTSSGNGAIQLTVPATGGYGVFVQISASVADATAAYYAQASNTQSNQSTLFSGLLGSSGNVMGLLIKGTGSTTAGGDGTGSNHVTIWGNTSNNANTALSIGNNTSYAERFTILNSGKVTISYAVNDSVAALTASRTSNNTGMGPAILAELTGSGAAVGDSVGLIYVTNHSSSTTMSTGLRIDMNGEATLVAHTSADVAGAYINVDRQHTGATTIEDTDGTHSIRLHRLLRSGHASANFTNNTPNVKITQTATQTSGTLTCSGSGISLSHNTSAAARTWAMDVTHNNINGGGLACGIDFSTFSVDEPIFKFVADAITVAGTASHQFAVDVGGTTFYLVGYTHGT